MDYGTVNGIFFGVAEQRHFKSFVWYSPKAFAANGYTVPTTWDELMALSDKIAATGKKPWCAGIGSGDATGWPPTDWLEDVRAAAGRPGRLRPVGEPRRQVQRPADREALAKMGDAPEEPDKYVNGGFGDVSTIASTTVQRRWSADPEARGDCSIHRQATFYESVYPAGTTFGPRRRHLRILPPADQRPVRQARSCGGGTFAGAFNDRPEVQAFQYYVTTPDVRQRHADNGASCPPNQGLQDRASPSPVLKVALATLQHPEAVFRFDASDLMPGAVGSDADVEAVDGLDHRARTTRPPWPTSMRPGPPADQGRSVTSVRWQPGPANSRSGPPPSHFRKGA